MSKELKALEALGNYEITYDETNDYTWTLSDTEEYELVKQALERNTPKKIIQTSNEQDFSLFDCPSCDTTMYYESAPYDWKYCIECGQKLDWTDEDEGEMNE